MSCLLFTICAILERDGQLRNNLFLHCDGGDGNWDDSQCVAMAILVQCDMVEEMICHRLPVAHTHNTGDAYWSIHSSDTKGRQGIGGHDITSPTELLQSFDRAYGKLKGDVGLASNQFVEATYDMKSIANEFRYRCSSRIGLG